MKRYSYPYLQDAHRKTYNNLKQMKASKMCGCFFCSRIFAVSDFPEDWLQEEKADSENTLQCPYCYMDSVLGDASGFPVTDAEFIGVMNAVFFNGHTEISSSPQDATEF